MKQHLRKGKEIRLIEVDTTSGEIITESVTEEKYMAGTKEAFLLYAEEEVNSIFI